ncbi:MAG: dehydrogenase [Bacteroidia bacterium]|nr:MAG: dehydrogenase [Bacteroidia bacterium]
MIFIYKYEYFFLSIKFYYFCKVDIKDLLNFRRLNQTAQNQRSARSDFQRDFDRLIFSSPFRRLQNKTQVFPLPGSVFVHNRLTHTLEVSTVGRSLATLCSWEFVSNNVNDFENAMHWGNAVAAACLAHDIGNPPFGHSGEAAISNFFQQKSHANWFQCLSNQQQQDFLKFDGNANTFRVLTHSYPTKRPHGFGLTYTVLASFVKYPWASDESEENKFGYFHAEKENFFQLFKEHMLVNSVDKFFRHPFVYLLEAADDICYTIIDLEDAHKLKIASTEKVQNWFLELLSNDAKDDAKSELNCIDDDNEKIAFLRGRVIHQLILDCKQVFCSYKKELLEGRPIPSLIKQLPDERLKIIRDIQKYSQKEIYNDRRVVEIELAGKQILGGLLEELIEGWFAYEQNPNDRFAQKIVNLIPQQFQVSPEKSHYDKILHIVDFVAGMTDLFAVELFQKLKGYTFPKFS